MSAGIIFRMKLKLYALLTTISLLITPLTLEAQRPNIALDSINTRLLKSHLEFIASDELEGRLTPSRGLDLAGKYIAANLSRLGFTPMGDNGTFFQNFPLTHFAASSEKSFATLNGKTLDYEKDYYLKNIGGKVEGELVYAGYGWRIPRTKTDPYTGLNIKGKIVVVSASSDFATIGLTPADSNASGDEAPQSPQDVAVKGGAVGVVYLISDADWTNALKQHQSRRVRISWSPPSSVSTDEPNPIPVLSLNPTLCRELLRGEALTCQSVQRLIKDKKPLSSFALDPKKKITFESGGAQETRMVRNVVAKWEGSDAQLKDEFVAVSAHYDHIGIKENAKPGEDAIYNGADDDGSGTVGVLSIAEALAKVPTHPKRSLLLIWHCGEEEGLWGSGYFVAHPVVPLKQMITLLNIDMIGRSKSTGEAKPGNTNLTSADEIYVIGSRRINPHLAEISEQVNAEYYHLKLNYKYDAPNDPENLYERSDHYNYAQKGVPIIFYFDGVHEDYHGVGDEVSKIDFAKMERVSRTIYATLWELAEAGLAK